MIVTAGLYYTDGAEWIDLPAWTRFFLDLGYNASIATNESPHRLVLGLALPSRAYAAAFIASGIVLARADDTHGASDTEIHFQKLSRLHPGTAVLYRKNDRKFPAIFEGVEDLNGKPHVRIRTQSKQAGGLSHLLPVNRASGVSISDEAPKPLPNNPTGRRVNVQTEFVSRWLGGADPYVFAGGSQLDCAIVGNLRQLWEEIVKTPLGFRSRTGVAAGTLQELLRVKRFLGQGEGYRSDVIPLRDDAGSPVADRHPPITLFDGGKGFLRWRHNWHESHWIVVLDRTAPDFPDAVASLNRGYALRPEYPEPTLGTLRRPPGVELLTYWEMR